MTLIELIESRRIAITPEWEGGWHVEVYDDQATVQYAGYGDTISDALHDALQVEAIE